MIKAYARKHPINYECITYCICAKYFNILLTLQREQIMIKFGTNLEIYIKITRYPQRSENYLKLLSVRFNIQPDHFLHL